MPLINDADSDQMRIANTADGTILIAWTLFGYDGSTEVLFSRSTDSGNSFSSPIVLAAVDDVSSYIPTIATDGVNGVGIVWMESTVDPENVDAVQGVFYSHSVDDGNTFSTPELLQRETYTSAAVSCPYIAMSSQNTYVAWLSAPYVTEADIAFTTSTDTGITFSAPIDISNLPEQSGCPHIGLDLAGNIYAVWENGSASNNNRVILFSKSTDKGASFTSPAIISPSPLDSFCSDIAVSDVGTIFITWSNGDPYEGTHQSFLVYSSDGGKTFSAPLKIPVITDEDSCPSIVARGLNNISFLWNGPLRLPNPNTVYVKPDIFYSSGTVSIP